MEKVDRNKIGKVYQLFVLNQDSIVMSPTGSLFHGGSKPCLAGKCFTIDQHKRKQIDSLFLVQICWLCK